MKKFSELSVGVQLVIFLAVAAAIVAVGEFVYPNLQAAISANSDLEAKVKKLQADNDAVRPNEKKLRDLLVENEQLERQLANLKTVVPDEREADSFIRMIKDSGNISGVEIRRFTARSLVAKDFVMEMPFELDVDGSYSSVMQFFDKLGKLQRIINITNLSLAPVSGAGKVRRKYVYSPNETVVGNCVASTFFSRETPAAGPKR